MNVLIFGGTSEGRRLSDLLSVAGHGVTLSVATGYGRDMASGNEGFAESAIAVMPSPVILAERLGREEIIGLLQKSAFDCVIDATHPYAVLATQYINDACRIAGIKYVRIKRPDSLEASGAVYVPDAAAAAKILNESDEMVLLTIGSKELEVFTHVANYVKRIFIRILPIRDSLEKALDLGFRCSNIICMQGPFDTEMNAATLKMTGAGVLVTKDSGDIGGFEAKVSAASSLGCKVIVISRPTEDGGCSVSELLAEFGIRETQSGLPLQPRMHGRAVRRMPNDQPRMHFPLFVGMRDKRVLVIGGGNVAERRIKVLEPFGADITVISPSSSDYITHSSSRGFVHLLCRKYRAGDIASLMPFLVIAASDERQANHEAMVEATRLNILISVADCHRECTCYFPAIAESDEFIVGIVSKNGNHAGVKKMAVNMRNVINA